MDKNKLMRSIRDQQGDMFISNRLIDQYDITFGRVDSFNLDTENVI